MHESRSILNEGFQGAPAGKLVAIVKSGLPRRAYALVTPGSIDAG